MNQEQVQEGQQQQQDQQNQGPKFSIFKMIFLFFIVQSIIGFFQKPNERISYINSFKDGDLLVKFYSSYSLQEIKVIINTSRSDPFIWHEQGIKYDFSYENFRSINFTQTAQELKQNPYLTAFVYVRNQLTDQTIYNSFKLCKFRAKKQVDQKNLLFDAQEEYMISKTQKNDSEPKVLHVVPKATIFLIHDTNSYPYTQIPPQLKDSNSFKLQNVLVYYFQNITGQLLYDPYIELEQFKLKTRDYLLVDDDTIPDDQQFEIIFEYDTYWIWKFMMARSMKDQGKVYEQFGMENIMDESAQDEFKEMFYETNFYLAAITVIVSLLHTVFSTLAIKNDIQYWKNLENMQGISVRLIYSNFIIDIIITLYLFDNETSKLILFQSVIEIGVDIWKILKTTKFKRREDGKFPYLTFNNVDSYVSTTAEHDSTAAKYLYKCLIPFYFGYLIYSLIYEEHKGWYSFFLNATVGFIYIFGFIQMTPQLYINYKLKSVAHLPWRTMIYKFLNTIIDDLFAFIITMPWLRRLSCFRDDVIFLIYLYQRRIYRVDKSRVDVGYQMDIDNDQIKEKTD